MNNNSLCSDSIIANFTNFHESAQNQLNKMHIESGSDQTIAAEINPITPEDHPNTSENYPNIYEGNISTNSSIGENTPLKKKKISLNIKMSNLSFNESAQMVQTNNIHNMNNITSTPAQTNNTHKLPKPDFFSACSKKRLSKIHEYPLSTCNAHDQIFLGISPNGLPIKKSLNILGSFPQSFRITDPMKIMRTINESKISRTDSGNVGSDPWDPLDKSLIKPILRERKVEYISFLGNGDTGTAIKCRAKDGSYFVLKAYSKPVKGATDLGYMIKEAAALSQLSHFNIVTYIESYVKDNHLFLKIEYCNGLNLRNIINNYAKIQETPSESKIKCFLTQIAGALNHIHAKGIVHYDIKPDNIFTVDIHLNEGSQNHLNDFDPQYQNYKIGDFGQCFISGVYNIDVCEGDSRYIGRETLEFIDEYYSMDSNSKFLPSPCSDIFALSLTTAEYCGCGELPSRGEEWQNIRNGNLPPINNKYSKELQKLLMIMICPEPDNRPSSEYVLNCKYLNS